MGLIGKRGRKIPTSYDASTRETNLYSKEKTIFVVEGGLEFRCVLFFFQAEDGIRDSSVTGVQTCALPISRLIAAAMPAANTTAAAVEMARSAQGRTGNTVARPWRRSFAMVCCHASQDRKSVV